MQIYYMPDRHWTESKLETMGNNWHTDFTEQTEYHICSAGFA